MKRINSFIMIACLSLSLLGGCSGGESNVSDYVSFDAAKNTIEVDFGKKDGTGVQNIKKYDMFTPTWTMTSGDTANYGAIDQFKSIDPIKAEAYRVDLMLGMGGMGAFTANSSELSGKTEEEWSITDAVVDGLTENGVIPYIVMVGIPQYAWGDKGSWRSTPDMAKYKEFVTNAATYLTNRGKRIIYETWNEPDLGGDGTFWTDSMNDLVDVNILQAKTIKEVNPDAEVAELGLCWPVTFIETGYWDYYMQRVREENHTIDAFSWHFYASHGGEFESSSHRDGGFTKWKSVIREAIAKGQKINPSMQTMQQHLTEFSPADAGDELIDQVGIVPSFYETIKLGLQATDISRISWNSYLTDDYGMIHPYSYQRRPVYYVLWSFGRLPVDKASVTISEAVAEDFGTMSGVDSRRAGVVVYNRHKLDGYGEKYVDQLKKLDAENTKSVTLKLKNVPFEAETCKIYLIDNEHVAYTATQDTPYLVFDRDSFADKLNENGEAEITLNIPGNASMYVEIGDESGTYELDDEKKLADTIVRKDYFYVDRGDDKPYAYMHENSLSAYVSMANEAKGSGTMCVTMDGLENTENLNVSYETWGGEVDNTEKDVGIGFRIDYRKHDGKYANSTFYYIRNYKNEIPVSSFGTGLGAENFVSIGEELSGNFLVNLKENAPQDWDGRIQITYQIANAGKGITSKFIIS